MPNGHGQRQEDEEKLIKAVEEDGWNLYPDPPEWVVSAAKSDGIDKGAGFKAKRKTYNGDNYVYLAVSSVHGLHIHVFSQKKSQYHETTPKEGICPNCQQYVRRYDDDDYLTCHRCGWQYKPLSERFRNIFG
ncbi:hypothetical protein [Halopenitus persicus]|uniref:hypothetical protein n=1 Tax=Halopenitus persicus TaxID=1048396 RepID=UPI0012FDDFED|nr:hypothetical protein [Halopenitus persicus]